MTTLSTLPNEIILEILSKLPTAVIGHMYLDAKEEKQTDTTDTTYMEILITAFQTKTTIILDGEFTMQHMDSILGEIPDKNKIKIRNVEINYNFIHQLCYENFDKILFKTLTIGPIYFHNIRINPYFITKLEFIDTKILLKGDNILEFIKKCDSLESLTLVTSKKSKIYLASLTHLRVKEFNLIGNFVCNHKFEVRLTRFLKSQRKSLTKLNLSIHSDFVTINRLLQQTKFRKLKQLTITTRHKHAYSTDISFITQSEEVTLINYNSNESWSMNFLSISFFHIKKIQLINIKEKNNLNSIMEGILQTIKWNGSLVKTDFNDWLASKHINLPDPILKKIYEPKENIFRRILNMIMK